MALDHKTRVSRATTTKAAHKRSQLGGERRDVTVAVARMAKDYEARIGELRALLAKAEGSRDNLGKAFQEAIAERDKAEGLVAEARQAIADAAALLEDGYKLDATADWSAFNARINAWLDSHTVRVARRSVGQ